MIALGLIINIFYKIFSFEVYFFLYNIVLVFLFSRFKWPKKLILLLVLLQIIPLFFININNYIFTLPIVFIYLGVYLNKKFNSNVPQFFISSFFISFLVFYPGMCLIIFINYNRLLKLIGL
tara:strand:+ start:12209 stop:12571 length:363 start_codon:yes stop_codon:yes gene_type:complete